MENVVIVIPVHEYNEGVKTMLANAIESVGEKEIYISTTKEIKKNIEEDFKRPLTFVTSAKNTSFQALINAAVKTMQKNKDKWFSILEYDDSYTSYWFDEAKRYYQVNPDVSVFLPLTQLVKESKKDEYVFVGYGNEAPWASAFSNEIGFVDFEVLSNYFDFYLTGSIINVDDFLTVGGLKESLKLVFWYEFLLRLTNKEKKVYVVPKIGYNHLVDRKGSLFDTYKTTLEEKEVKGWYDIAKQECYFMQDRNKTYDKNKETEEEED